jgi:hypothetical protein
MDLKDIDKKEAMDFFLHTDRGLNKRLNILKNKLGLNPYDIKRVFDLIGNYDDTQRFLEAMQGAGLSLHSALTLFSVGPTVVEKSKVDEAINTMLQFNFVGEDDGKGTANQTDEGEAAKA